MSEPQKERAYPAYESQLILLARQLRENATFPEHLLWSRLRRRQLGVRFLRQRPVDQYIVDFLCPAHHLVIEIDGRSHNGCEKGDMRCQARLETLGLTVLRLSNDAVLHDVDAVVAKIAAWLEQIETSA